MSSVRKMDYCELHADDHRMFYLLRSMTVMTHRRSRRLQCLQLSMPDETRIYKMQAVGQWGRSWAGSSDLPSTPRVLVSLTGTQQKNSMPELILAA